MRVAQSDATAGAMLGHRVSISYIALVPVPLRKIEWLIMPAVRKKKLVAGKSGAMTSTLRCFQVLELLAEDPFELSVSDISELLSMPRASAHRLCKTLVEGGFIDLVPASKRYRLTPKSLWVGSGYLRHSSIYHAAFFPMQSLAKQIPGTAQLGVLIRIHSALHALNGNQHVYNNRT